ncbi:TPA: opacity family porin [Pasteurella multocida]
MKKSVFVLALGTLCAATASANFYVQGDLGYSKLKFEDVSKSKFSPSLAVGYKFDDFRLALDYSHYGKLTHTEKRVQQFQMLVVIKLFLDQKNIRSK